MITTISRRIRKTLCLQLWKGRNQLNLIRKNNNNIIKKVTGPHKKDHKITVKT